MYSIALKQKQYATYILNDQTSGARVEVVPERGGIITQWDIKDTPLLYLDTERFKDPTKSVRGGIPILFPICGNLPNDTYTLEGKEYTLVQHGFGRTQPWKVVDQGVAGGDEGGAFIKIALESNEETLKVYPFDFLLEFTYRLQGDRLILKQSYTNKSDRPMPFSTGFHPYFEVSANREDKAQLELDLPVSTYDDNISKGSGLYEGTLDWASPEIDIAFRPVTAQQASISDPNRGVKVTMSYDEAFTTLVFWTVEGKGFYCLEPWSAPRNAINTGTDILTLAPNETKMLTVTLSATLFEPTA